MFKLSYVKNSTMQMVQDLPNNKTFNTVIKTFINVILPFLSINSIMYCKKNSMHKAATSKLAQVTYIEKVKFANIGKTEDR